MNLGDLVEHWTLVGAEQDMVARKHRDTQLGFAPLLKFYGRFGRFPRSRVEVHDDALEFVAAAGGGCCLAGLLRVGRTHHQTAESRAHLGFRECTVADAETLTDWLAGDYAQKERRFELAKDAALAELRARRSSHLCQTGWRRSCGRACIRRRRSSPSKVARRRRSLMGDRSVPAQPADGAAARRRAWGSGA
jgi:hypothetical protein